MIKTNHSIVPHGAGFRSLLAVGLLLAAVTLQAATEAQIEAELSGNDSSTPAALPVPDLQARQQALGALPVTGLLLIPESTNDRVMAFDPVTGDLIDADFIPADPDNLSTPIHAILSADGASILVSDQLDDVVQQYDITDGSYIGVFAPAGGVDVGILDNVRGMALDPDNGNLLVSVGGGANDDAIAEFDTAGNPIGNRVANAAGGLDSPFDVLPVAGELQVAGITSDAIHTYQLNGTYIDDFAPVDTFPEQIAVSAPGGFLVANFSGTQEGVIEFDAAGNVIGVYNPATLGGYRGAYELPNGNILTTNGGGVHEIDRSGNLVETKIDGVSARFIELVVAGEDVVLPPPPAVPALSGLSLLLLALLVATLGWLAARRRGRIA
ncbi:MAG: hypothetical protein KKC01_08025 [Gammaproteobacteria bacterium]|nr:hypothetical protein [Gammaproteobacteria bacterium]